MPAARKRKMVAQLLEHFHLTLDQYARLTDRQIIDLYFHPRDEHGTVATAETVEAKPIAPVEVSEEAAPEEMLEDELRNIDTLASIIKLPASEVVRLKMELRAKFAAREANDGSGSG